MTNDKLAQHISNELWVQKSKVVEVLEKFEETQPTKQNLVIDEQKPLTADDLVLGSKYVPLKKSLGVPFKESVMIKKWKEYNLHYLYYLGTDKYGQHIFSLTLGHPNIDGQSFLPSDVIPYIEPKKERDYTGVRFKQSWSNKVRVIEKGAYSGNFPYSISGEIRVYYTQEEVERLLANGNWIELPQEEEHKPLTAKDLVVGGKYVPISKSVGVQLDECPHFKNSKKQGYFYYLGYDEEKSQYTFCINRDGNKYSNGAHYLPSDVIPYVEEETPTMHASNHGDIEERVKALESKCEDIVKETSFHIEAINKIVTGLNSKVYGYDGDYSLLTKRNLSIETSDWKKVECLSWDDVKEIFSSELSVENYIKNKLKK